MRLSGRTFRIIIVALLALSLSWPSFVVIAEAAARPEVIYYEGDKLSGKHVYHNSGILYDGGVWEYSVDITDTDPVLYVLNDVGQTYTSLDPDIIGISETSCDEDDPTYMARLDLKKKGIATIKIEIPAQKKYDACTLYCRIKVVAGRRVQFMKSVAETNGNSFDTMGLHELTDGETDKGSFSFLMDDVRPRMRLYGYDAVYSSMTEDLVSIDQDGWLTLKGAGEATIKAVVPSDGKIEEETFYCQFVIGKKYGVDMDYTQAYTSDISAGGVQLDIAAKPGIDVTYMSADENIASVDSVGYVTFVSPGTVKIYASFTGNTYYQEGKVSVTVNITGEDQNQNQNQNGSSGSGSSQNGSPQNTSIPQVVQVSQAPQTAALAAAPKIAKPKLKCSKRKKRKNKLTWSRVANATGYELYIKYPGTKKYVKALTKSARVKSVTHKGLTRGKKYTYKIRAFVQIGGTRYYGPFSKAVKVKAK